MSKLSNRKMNREERPSIMQNEHEDFQMCLSYMLKSQIKQSKTLQIQDVPFLKIITIKP